MDAIDFHSVVIDGCFTNTSDSGIYTWTVTA